MAQIITKGDKTMLIKGTPCPECDGFYFAVPWCSKCNWIDEKWFKEEMKINKKLMKLYREYQASTVKETKNDHTSRNCHS